MSFFKDILGRDDKWSSKKLWYNVACLTATIVVLVMAYRNTMEAYAYICLYSVYLVTVGGFEVIPKILAMILEFKSGKEIKSGDTSVSVEIQK